MKSVQAERCASSLQSGVRPGCLLRYLMQLSLLLAFVADARESQSDKVVSQEQVTRHLEKARDLIDARQPSKAIEQHLDPVIAHFERAYAESDKVVFCAREPTQALEYMTAAAAAETAGAQKSATAVVLGPDWADAYHLKGFALVELKDLDGAGEALHAALRLSPREPQYLSELAYVTQGRGDSEEALKLFGYAEEAAKLIQDADRKQAEIGRACRGQGYALIEMQKLDDADLQYRKCLDLNPGDKISQGELEYIDQVREN